MDSLTVLEVPLTSGMRVCALCWETARLWLAVFRMNKSRAF